MSIQKSKSANFFFMHIPKTAGTSFRTMLYEQFEQREIYPNVQEMKNKRRRPYTSVEALDKINPNRIKNIRLLVGHLPIVAPEKIFDDCLNLVFLREPTERAISNIYHLKLMQKGMSEFRDMAPEEIFEKQPRRFINRQIRFFLKDGDTIRNIGKKDLNRAKRNLKKFDFIGLTEDFDRSVKVAEKLFSWELGEVKKKNTVGSKKGKKVISTELRAKLDEVNKYDKEFYDFGKELFEGMCTKLL